jgi:large subunit ribosomal protein L35
MPKIKTHKGAAKRFRITATGKVLRMRGQKSHILEKKSAKRKRLYASPQKVTAAYAKTIRRAAPYLEG